MATKKTKKYGIIKQLEEQALKIAKLKDNVLSNDPEIDKLYSGKLPRIKDKDNN